MWKIGRPFLFFALFSILLCCSKKEEDVQISSISLNTPTVEIITGETFQLQVSISPSNATNKSVIWGSSKQSVATVSTSGLVTAISEGTTTITATSEGKSASCAVTVNKKVIPVEYVTIDSESVTIYEGRGGRAFNLLEGESAILTAIVTPDDATENNLVRWSSGNIEVARIDENGLVTAISAGQTTITATAGGVYDEIYVNVIEKIEHFLTFQSEGKTTISFIRGDWEEDSPVVYYSFDKKNWEYMGKITFTSDKPLYIYGDNPNGFSKRLENLGVFSSSGDKFSVSGSIMSLLGQDEDNVIIPSYYCFARLFYQCQNLTSAPDLPATTLKPCCYYCMFADCSNLTSAPELPATTMMQNCYREMFNGCTSLAKAPELPATTLASNCYRMMFNACTSLAKAPELPATTLAQACYDQMFLNCINLTTAPSELPAMTMEKDCYREMFNGCTSLAKAPKLPATTLASNCYRNMFTDCRSLTSVPELLPATTLAENCYGSMFSRCTSLTTAPILPATTLANNCYYAMFKGCTSLTTAPELPATTLVNECYHNMFLDCSSLNYVKALFTTTPSASYTNNWVSGVASTGTFVKSPDAEWEVTGPNGVPEGWAVEVYIETK